MELVFPTILVHAVWDIMAHSVTFPFTHHVMTRILVTMDLIVCNKLPTISVIAILSSMIHFATVLS
jgi:hypothetical protein